ncbi:hypothetical protein XENOCAPTIV_030835 [Xenoophorus captivus]|uniref:Uncharacterized protein n=1 Tax=Xenoophorus captivus TaxID=1517983 RepID=A0ABV0S5H3_9TELE
MDQHILHPPLYESSGLAGAPDWTLQMCFTILTSFLHSLLKRHLEESLENKSQNEQPIRKPELFKSTGLFTLLCFSCFLLFLSPKGLKYPLKHHISVTVKLLLCLQSSISI